MDKLFFKKIQKKLIGFKDKKQSLGFQDELETRELIPQIKEGVDYVFEQNPELEKIGTKEQYSEYLDTVFPKSSIKDILYHGALERRDQWRKNQHFGTLEAAKSRTEFIKQVTTKFQTKEIIFPVLINLLNVKRVHDADYNWEPVINLANQEKFDGLVYENNNQGKNADSYLVFDPERIYLLGSETDMERFKGFIENKNTV